VNKSTPPLVLCQTQPEKLKIKVEGDQVREPRYKIQYDAKTIFVVREHQLFRPKWIAFFGSVDKVKDFIIENNK
jgi:hypothetical protein